MKKFYLIFLVSMPMLFINDYLIAEEILYHQNKDEIELLGVIEYTKGQALSYADDDLRKNKTFILKVVSLDGRALKYVHEILKKDRDVVLKATEQYGYAFKYAHESLKRDKDIVLTGIKMYGNALDYADESLKKDKELISIAIENGADASNYPINEEPTIEELKHKAKSGDQQAQFSLALAYVKGESVEQNFSFAVDWFIQAAEKGHTGAQYYLGLHYENGKGVITDYKEAARWYKMVVANNLSSTEDREYCQNKVIELSNTSNKKELLSRDNTVEAYSQYKAQMLFLLSLSNLSGDNKGQESIIESRNSAAKIFTTYVYLAKNSKRNKELLAQLNHYKSFLENSQKPTTGGLVLTDNEKEAFQLLDKLGLSTKKENSAKSINKLEDNNKKHIEKLVGPLPLVVPEGEIRRDFDLPQNLHDAVMFSANESFLYSYDNRYIASSSLESKNSYAIKWWDVKSGRLIKKVLQKTGFKSIGFTPNNHFFVSEYKDGIQFWDINSGNKKKFYKNEGVKYLKIGPNGKYLASLLSDNLINLWDIKTDKLIKTIKSPEEIKSLLFSPNGKLLTGIPKNNRVITFWNVNSGDLVKSIKGQKDGIADIKFSLDSRYIASIAKNYTDNSNSIFLWDLDKGDTEGKKILEGHKSSINTIAFDSKGRIASGSNDNTIKLWDTNTGSLIKTFEGHSDDVEVVAFGPDGDFLASGSSDGSIGPSKGVIMIWNVSSGEREDTLLGHWSNVVQLKYSNDGKYIASSSWDNTIRVWDVKSKKTVQSFGGHVSPIFSVSTSSDGKYIVSGSKDDVIRVWDSSSGELLKLYEGQTYNDIKAVEFSPDNKYLATGSGSGIKLWDMMSGKLLNVSKGHSSDVVSIDFSPDSQYFVSSANGIFGDKKVRLWDGSKGLFIKDFVGHEEGVNSAVFSPDGKKIASASNDDSIIIWDVDSGKIIKSIKAHSDDVIDIDYSPDGKYLVSISRDNTVKIWDPKSGKIIKSLDGDWENLSSVRFSTDGENIYVATSFYIKNLEVKTGKLISSLSSHQRYISSLSLEGDGRFLVSASYDGSIKRWDTKKQDVIKTYLGGLNGNWVSWDDNKFLRGDDGSLLLNTDGSYFSFVNKGTRIGSDNDELTINNSDTVFDNKTKLIWKRCAEGLSGDKCEQGEAIKLSYENAKKHAKESQFANNTDWRIPTISELNTLVYCSTGKRRPISINKLGFISKNDDKKELNGQCMGNYFDRPTVNHLNFPHNYSDGYWSSSKYGDSDEVFWTLSFQEGNIGFSSGKNLIRLVRSESATNVKGILQEIKQKISDRLSDVPASEPRPLPKKPVVELDDEENIQVRSLQKSPINFKYHAAGLFYKGVAPVKDEDDLWGLISTNGNWVVLPEYADVGRYHDGYMAVKQNEKFAFLDAEGELVTSFKYDGARYFSEGLSAVKLGNKWGYINSEGDLKISAQYDRAKEFKEGFAPVRVKKKWGYINKQGEWLLKPKFDAAYGFSEDKAVVVYKNKRGFINTNGKYVIKPSYRRVQRFTEGIAPASYKKNQWFFINEDNNKVIDSLFSDIRNFSEGLCSVRNTEGKWGYINKQGRLVIPYQFDKAYDFRNGLALVNTNDIRGFINITGKVLVSLEYEDAFQFNEGLAPVKKNGLWGYIPEPVRSKEELNTNKVVPLKAKEKPIEQDSKIKPSSEMDNQIECALQGTC